jgi:hypothetical protein
LEDSGNNEQQQEIDHKAKKAVDKARFDLKLLLEQPLEGKKPDMNNRKRSFVVFAK